MERRTDRRVGRMLAGIVLLCLLHDSTSLDIRAARQRVEAVLQRHFPNLRELSAAEFQDVALGAFALVPHDHDIWDAAARVRELVRSQELQTVSLSELQKSSGFIKTLQEYEAHTRALDMILSEVFDFTRPRDGGEDAILAAYPPLSATGHLLLFTDPPLSEEELATVESMRVCHGKGPFGRGPLGLREYPRLARLAARVLHSAPLLYDGSSGDAFREKERAGKADADRGMRRSKNRIRARSELQDRVYIAANLHNAGIVMQTWKLNLVELVRVLGPKRVSVCIVENASSDGTDAQIAQLRTELRQMGARVHFQHSSQSGAELAQSVTPTGIPLDRIRVLAALRNMLLTPLYVSMDAGEKYSKVLFLNDVAFRAADAVELLLTNDTRYDVACGMDRRVDGYDLWVARDIEGNMFSAAYPYTLHPESQTATRMGKPYRIRACWSGMAAFDGSALEETRVHFRRSRAGECEHSECFLITRDLARLGHSTVILNPLVNVGVSEAYAHANEFLFDRPLMRLAMELYADPRGTWLQRGAAARHTREADGTECTVFPAKAWPYCVDRFPAAVVPRA